MPKLIRKHEYKNYRIVSSEKDHNKSEKQVLSLKKTKPWYIPFDNDYKNTDHSTGIKSNNLSLAKLVRLIQSLIHRKILRYH